MRAIFDDEKVTVLLEEHGVMGYEEGVSNDVPGYAAEARVKSQADSLGLRARMS